MSKESPSTSLILRPASSELHDGQWVCVVNNTIAEEKVVIRVAVVSPLEVALEPKQATVDAGRSSTFNCSSRGGPPVSRAPLWFHNAKPMGDILREHLHDQRIRLIEPHILHIAAVHREDIGKIWRGAIFANKFYAVISSFWTFFFPGVYQCVVQSEHEEAQASAELKLGDVAPMLLETFLDRQVVESGVGNSAISLRCAAIGTPLPQIRWYLDDQPVPNLSRYRLGDHVTNEGKVVSYVNISNIRVVDGGEVRKSEREFLGILKFIIFLPLSVLLRGNKRGRQGALPGSRSGDWRTQSADDLLGTPQPERGGGREHRRALSGDRLSDSGDQLAAQWQPAAHQPPPDN